MLPQLKFRWVKHFLKTSDICCLSMLLSRPSATSTMLWSEPAARARKGDYSDPGDRRRHARCGVHHGVPELRAAVVQCAILRRAEGTEAGRLPEAPLCREGSLPGTLGRLEPGHFGRLSELDEALVQDVLHYVSARDLARLEITCRCARASSASLGGRSICEHVAWLQLERCLDERQSSGRALRQLPYGSSLRGSMHRLHLATSRVFLTILMRRSGNRRAREHIATICGAAAIARDLTAPLLRGTAASTAGGLQVLSERDLSSGVALSDGVFAEAGLFAREERDMERVEVSFDCAEALGLAVRTIDNALAVGDCVVDAVPESLRSTTRIEANGCWVIRRVNALPCFSPEAYRRQLEAIRSGTESATSSASSPSARRRKRPCGSYSWSLFDEAKQLGLAKGLEKTTDRLAAPHPIKVGPEAKAQVRERLAREVASAPLPVPIAARKRRQPDRPPPVRLEFEHAYDRRDLALPLDTATSTAVQVARQAFGIEVDGSSTVLFATGAKPGRTACWTAADRRTTLADYGLHAGDHVTFLCCFLPDMHAGRLNA